MDIWRATHEQIKQAALRLYGKMPVDVLKQSGYYAFVYFADGTNGTIYEWMLD